MDKYSTTRKILVTGGAGFIGSHLVQRLLREERSHVVTLDLLTYAGNIQNLGEAMRHPRHTFVQGDIRNGALLHTLFSRYAFDAVVHCAAESHVERSFLDPALFVSVNVSGTQTLLDTAIRHWRLRPGDPRCKEYRPGVRFVQVSTDEVYGDLGPAGSFAEDSPLRPNNPYAATKASADLLALSYQKTFGLPLCITRGTNTFGPNQHTEKLIPQMILCCMLERPLPIQGNGSQVRDFLYVEDHVSGILAVLDKGKDGEIYHIGMQYEENIVSVAERIAGCFPGARERISFVEDRLFQDRRFSLNCGKIKTELGFAPQHRFLPALESTIAWYRKQFSSRLEQTAATG